MRFLVDSNVLSEPTKPAPDQGVVGWLQANESDVAVDAIVLGELSAGIGSLPTGRKRKVLDAWLARVVDTIVCLPWDARVAMRWGRLVAALRAKGRSMPLLDSQIAASALSHGLIIATRNVDDFRHAGVELVDPIEG